MGADRADVSGSAQWRPTVYGLPAHGGGWDFIYCVERLRLADAAQMLRAGFDGTRFILVHAADIQDRDGAVDVLKVIRCWFPWLRHVFPEGSYARNKLKAALQGHGSLDRMGRRRQHPNTYPQNRKTLQLIEKLLNQALTKAVVL